MCVEIKKLAKDSNERPNADLGQGASTVKTALVKTPYIWSVLVYTLLNDCWKCVFWKGGRETFAALVKDVLVWAETFTAWETFVH